MILNHQSSTFDNELFEKPCFVNWSLYYRETSPGERQEGNRKQSYPFLQRPWHNVLKNPQGILFSTRLYTAMWSWEICTFFTLLTSTEVLTVTANFCSGAVSTAVWKYKRFTALGRYHLEFFSSNSFSSWSSWWQKSGLQLTSQAIQPMPSLPNLCW